MNVLVFSLLILLAGYALSLPLAILRNTIDQRRGGLNEVVVVCAMLLGAMLFLALHAYAGRFGLVLQAAPYAKFLLISLTVFVVARLSERWRAGEVLQLADLFRFTTSAALTTFALTTLPQQVHGIDVCLLCLTYILADKATASSLPGRNLAIVFSSSFLAYILSAFLLGHSSLELFDDLGILSWGTIDFQSSYGSFALLAFVVAIVSAPLVMHWIFNHAPWLQILALRLAAWRCSFGAFADLIRIRPAVDLWHFRSGVCFLNHGSFGAVPILLRSRQRKLQAECEDEPMDFLSRQVESRWMDARFKLATWLGTQAENIAFCENATAGMNEIARWFPLATGDEVLLNDHEYGAVRRIWQRRCAESGANLITATLPLNLENPQQITQAILEHVNPRTKLVVFSHITSPTAIRLPVQQICEALQQPAWQDQHIATCIDGPHALLQEQFRLHQLGCDFYTGSCHKWLCAPLGSGFLYVAPRWHAQISPLRVSWGRLPPAEAENWTEEMLWTGSRDYSAYLAVPQAIDFFNAFDVSRLDARNHALACYAQQRLCTLPGARQLTPSGREWFGWMVAVWLPNGDHSSLQQRLWKQYKIEVPIVHFANRYLVRVSCQLYNTSHDIDFLLRALHKEILASPPA